VPPSWCSFLVAIPPALRFFRAGGAGGLAGGIGDSGQVWLLNSTLIRRAPMTDAVTGVNALPGKTSDADMLRGMAGPCGRCFAAGRLTMPEVGALAGAGRGGKTTGRPRRAQRLPRARRAQAGGDGGVAPPKLRRGSCFPGAAPNGPNARRSSARPSPMCRPVWAFPPPTAPNRTRPAPSSASTERSNAAPGLSGPLPTSKPSPTGAWPDHRGHPGPCGDRRKCSGRRPGMTFTRRTAAGGRAVIWLPKRTAPPSTARVPTFMRAVPMKRAMNRFGGAVIDLVWRAELHQIRLVARSHSGARNGDAVAHCHGFRLVLRDMDHKRTLGAVKAHDLGAHRGAEPGIGV